MSDIVAFLAARFDEDERRARQALSDSASGTTGSGVRIVDGELAIMPSAMSNSLTLHFVMNSPPRVLREVAAKRKLLEWCAEVAQHVDWATIDERGSLLHDPNPRATHTAVLALRMMAAPYEDSYGYDPAWRVE